MLLFEHKQYLQSCSAEKLNVNGDIVFENSGSLMPTKMARRDYNELLPGSVTSRTQINPTPGNTQQRGRGHAALL